LARRERERFTGWIIGVGTACGYLAGDRPLAQVPTGDDRRGGRSLGRPPHLYAPTQELAEFLAGAYAFDDIDHPPAVAGMVASASARRAMARNCAMP
jgi:hypothetical protein